MLSLCLQHHALFSQVSLTDECSWETGSGQALGSNIRWEGWGGGSKGEQEGRELGRAVPGAGERESRVKQQSEAGVGSSQMPWFQSNILSSLPITPGRKMMLVKGLEKKQGCGDRKSVV